MSHDLFLNFALSLIFLQRLKARNFKFDTEVVEATVFYRIVLFYCC